MLCHMLSHCVGPSVFRAMAYIILNHSLFVIVIMHGLCISCIAIVSYLSPWALDGTHMDSMLGQGHGQYIVKCLDIQHPKGGPKGMEIPGPPLGMALNEPRNCQARSGSPS